MTDEPSTPAAPRGRWLTRELLLRLMPALALVGALATALGAWSAQQLTDRIFDHWLLDGARALSTRLVESNGRAALPLSHDAEVIMLFDDIDRTWYSVVQGGTLLGGRFALPSHGRRAATYAVGSAFDGTIEGLPVRIAQVHRAMPSGDVLVSFAETLDKRSRARSRMLSMLWPFAVLALVAGLAVVLAVRRTVQPLQAMAAHWDAQSHASLAPVLTDSVPRELIPFARALNGLLERMRTILMRERQFSSVAAHQLRTPLTGLRLGLARAAEQPDLASTRAVLAELERLMQRTARMTQQMLSLGRLDPEVRRILEAVPVDLQQLAEEVGAGYLDRAAEAGIDFSLTPCAAPVRAHGQPDLLAEALANLLDNAIGCTPRGGRVAIEFDAMPPAMHVVDSGPGIPPERRDAMRQRFVRGEGTERAGSGLGLAIVGDIAELHGGRLELDTSAWGGLRASIVLPG